MAGDASNWVRVAALASGACVISAIAALTGPAGTHRVPTPQLGARSSRSKAPITATA
jgi:hypothetical protein